MAGTHRALGIVTVCLQVLHALATVAMLAIAAFIALHLSSVQFDGVLVPQTMTYTLLGAAALHILAMVVTPLWSWLMTRNQRKVSRLWAWLGYFIPLASYFMPARTLLGLVDEPGPKAARLRSLIVAWSVARDLASVSGLALTIFALLFNNEANDYVFMSVVVYVMAIILAANALSLVVLGRMRAWVAMAAIQSRHAEVF